MLKLEPCPTAQAKELRTNLLQNTIFYILRTNTINSKSTKHKTKTYNFHWYIVEK